MKIGINGSGMVQKASVQAITDHAAAAETQGFAHYWLAEHPTGGLDALTTLALVGQTVTSIELGTAIVPTFPRHPLTLAGQSLTVADAIGERLTLGHRAVSRANVGAIGYWLRQAHSSSARIPECVNAVIAGGQRRIYRRVDKLHGPTVSETTTTHSGISSGPGATGVGSDWAMG
jgi:alkanesulfonate monooxygenase SsuD/methylene tetrahydromethanopterin reductase-like flavin-dependent oxidoreductase (luciferase family)